MKFKSANYFRFIEEFKDPFKEAFLRLAPGRIFKSPIICVVYIIANITLLVSFIEVFVDGYLFQDPIWFSISVSLSVWFILIFANFAEALAEQKGKRYTDKIHNIKEQVSARLYETGEFVSVNRLKKGDIIKVLAGETVPCDGIVIKGVASVDESEVSGESEFHIKEGSSNNNFVMARTKVISDNLIIRVIDSRKNDFLNKMLSMVGSASRNVSETERAVNFFLGGLTIIYIFMCFSIIPIASFLGQNVSAVTVCCLLICVMPTTAAALSAPVSISAIYKLFKMKILAVTTKTIDLAGDIDILMIDKTGTITSGNRLAYDIIALEKVDLKKLISAAGISAFEDETVEGKSISDFLKNKFGYEFSADEKKALKKIKFSAKTKFSGTDYGRDRYRIGAVSALTDHLKIKVNKIPQELNTMAQKIGNEGGTPLFVAKNGKVLGVIHMKDTVRSGIANDVSTLYDMGVKVVLVTGDNFYTAQTIAREAGIKDFICEADPERKLYHVKEFQRQGNVVAFVGDGSNDAPALSQAEIGYTLNSCPKICREAANIVDLGNNPMKIIKLIEIGRETLATRGCLTTFSLVSDIAKYFVMIPAIFTPLYPQLKTLNFMMLYSPHTAILSSAIFNTIIIIMCMPFSLTGVKYKPIQTTRLVKRYFTIFGIVGFIVPFVGIKLIDILLELLVS